VLGRTPDKGMVGPEHDDRTHNRDEHAVEVEACDARRADGRKQEPTDDCANDAKHNVEQKALASATIELAPDQKVISTGPYALVRHPMYAGALVMLLGIPLALGSWWGLLVIVAMMPALIWRLSDEEKFLARSLPGYVGYQKEVRYRLIPLVW
jgi:hypothetical protein